MLAWLAATRREADATLRLLTWLAIAATITLVWLRPFFASYWMDESLTAWFASSSLPELWRRGVEHSGGSPIPHLLPWSARQLLGDSEAALRLPSLLAMLGAAACLYRLLLSPLGRTGALLGVWAFALHPTVAFEAHNARPYAFAMLLLGLTLVGARRLALGGGYGVAVLVGGCGAALLHQHIVLALGALAPLSMLFFSWRRPGSPLRRGPLILAGAVGLGLAALALPWVLAALSRRGELSYLQRPGLNDGFGAVCPPELALAALIAVVTAMLLRPRAVQRALVSGARAGAREDWMLIRRSRRLVPWAAVAVLASPGVLFVAALGFGVQLFTDRYLIVSAFGYAALAATLLVRHAPRRVVLAVLLVGTLAGIVSESRSAPMAKDWRAASAALQRMRASHPGLHVHTMTGFAEAARIGAEPPSAERREYLNAPFLAYGVDPEGLWPMPLRPQGPGAREAVHAELELVIASGRPLLLILARARLPWLELYRERLRAAGWSLEALPDPVGTIGVSLATPAGAVPSTSERDDR